MKTNKANMFNVWGLIISFIFLTLVGVLSVVLVYDLGAENILTPIHDTVQTTGATTGISDTMSTAITSWRDDYLNWVVPFDLYFLLSFISFFVFTIVSSIKAREQSIMSFFGMLTFGLIIFLSILGVIVLVKDWFVLNFITNFLDFDLGTTPIIEFYLNNIAIISFMWALILLLVNKLNFVGRENSSNDINLPGGNV